MAQAKRGIVFKDGKNPKYNQDNQQRNTNLHFSKCLFQDKKWLQTYSAQLEDQFRKVVKEEIEQAIQRFPPIMSRSFLAQGESSGSKQYKLQFEGKLPTILFTENKVVAEGDAPVKIQLLDTFSGHLIRDGPLSSKRVEIVVLDGHFNAEQREQWTKEDFSGHILFERENKRPLLVGERVTGLRNGIGFVDDICITDNSSWQRSKMFRLGAKLVGAEQDQVMEAVSNPFKVKDRRGETYRKHIIPAPEDEVWRLCWIAKKGKIHDRLKEHNIQKVKDLVAQYHNDQSLLRNILKVTPKKWDEIIKQATTCFGNACTIPKDLAKSNIPIDQQELQESASRADAREHIHHPDQQSMALDSSFLDQLLVVSNNNNVHLSTLDFTEPSLLSTTMFNVQPTSWPPDQSINRQNIGMLSSIPDASFNTSNTAKVGTCFGSIG